MTGPSLGPSNVVIDLRADLAELSRLAQATAEFMVRHHLADDMVTKMDLVLEEIVTNIISYGFEAGATPIIRVHLLFDGECVTARVEDNGRAFDPLRAALAPVDTPIAERRIGGLGIRLVRSLMDRVTYSREQDRNVVVLVKSV